MHFKDKGCVSMQTHTFKHKNLLQLCFEVVISIQRNEWINSVTSYDWLEQCNMVTRILNRILSQKRVAACRTVDRFVQRCQCIDSHAETGCNDTSEWLDMCEDVSALVDRSTVQDMRGSNNAFITSLFSRTSGLSNLQLKILPLIFTNRIFA